MRNARIETYSKPTVSGVFFPMGLTTLPSCSQAKYNSYKIVFFIVIDERPETNFNTTNTTLNEDDERIQANNIKNLERSTTTINHQQLINPIHKLLDTSKNSTIIETTMEYKCTYCLKVFHSKATLDIHLMTKRHDWRLKKAIEMMERGDKDTEGCTTIKNGNLNCVLRAFISLALSS